MGFFLFPLCVCFPASSILVSVLVGISFLFPFLACVVPSSLVVLAAFHHFSSFVGLLVASSSLQAACILAVSGGSALLLVSVGHLFLRWVLDASIFWLFPFFLDVEVGHWHPFLLLVGTGREIACTAGGALSCFLSF